MKVQTILAAIFLAAVCAGRLAADPAPPDDPLARFLFPPDKVLGRAEEIGLDDAQRKTVRAELQRAQSRFLDLQLDMQPEAQKLAKLLQGTTADEAKVLEQAARVMAIEHEVKTTQLTLLVRIKNLLTPAQQAKLREMQGAER